MIKIIQYSDALKYENDPGIINTTSRSKTFSKGLSPFFVGPIKLYDTAPCKYAENLENAWQFSKVYENYTDENGNPTQEYFSWAKKGFESKRAERYPMGKGAIPLYSWFGERLTYIEARKKIYIPLYSKAVVQTQAYKKIKDLYKKLGYLILQDFDGYDHETIGLSLDDVINSEQKKMGHAFVLKMCLLGE